MQLFFWEISLVVNKLLLVGNSPLNANVHSTSLQVRIDPRNKELDLDSLMYGKITHLNDEDMKKQEGDYIYRYRYNGGGASQVWLGSGRYSDFRVMYR